jgi:hypothetical protein
LANDGYPVWRDQTKLLSGERFWEDIQEAIKNRTFKFLLVLSRAANQKRGALDELECAIGTGKKNWLSDFTIPPSWTTCPSTTPTSEFVGSTKDALETASGMPRAGCWSW